MTTKKWIEAIEDVKFKMFIPSYRLGFIVDGVQFSHGAFGVVVLKLQENYDIELMNKGE